MTRAQIVGAVLVAFAGGDAFTVTWRAMAPQWAAGHIDVIHMLCAALFMGVGVGTLVGYLYYRLTDALFGGTE